MRLDIIDRCGKGYIREGLYLVDGDGGKFQSCYFIGEMDDVF